MSMTAQDFVAKWRRVDLSERSAVQQAQGASQPVHHWPGTAARELAETFDTHLARIQRVANRSSRRREPAGV